jgi:hypothetical protein
MDAILSEIEFKILFYFVQLEISTSHKSMSEIYDEEVEQQIQIFRQLRKWTDLYQFCKNLIRQFIHFYWRKLATM